MTEADYIKVQALTQLRVARDVLREIVPESAGIDRAAMVDTRARIAGFIDMLQDSVGDLEESDA